jgi:ribosome-associated protein
VADAPAESGIRVNKGLSIPRSELTVRTTRASGAGGQHVNKTESRVEVVWNVATSLALDEDRRGRLLERLAGRLTGEGELRVVASDTRSQLQNRELAEGRLAEVVRRALIVPKVRKATRPSRAAKEARLTEKKRQGDKKRVRRRPLDD